MPLNPATLLMASVGFTRIPTATLVGRLVVFRAPPLPAQPSTRAISRK